MAANKNNKALNVPHLRFPGFNGEWEQTTLGKIGKTFNGLTGKSGNDFGQGFPYITYKSVFDDSKIDIFRVEYVEITDIEQKKEIQNKVQYGDVFFTTSSETPDEVGMSSVLLDEVNDYYLNSFCFGYRLNSLSETIPEFMRFLLRSQTIRRKMFVLAQGSTRFNISKREVMGMLINIPEGKEQRKIANLLTLLDERIATQNKIIEKLETLIKALSHKLTSQKEPNTLLKDCLVCHSSTLLENNVKEKGKYPVYGATGICGYTDENDISGDAILIIKDGASVGTATYATGKYSVIGTLNYLQSSQDNYLLPYIYYSLKAFNFAPYITGMAIPHIYFRDYGKAKIWCPDIVEQKRIATALSTMDFKLQIEQNILRNLISQKQYLLSNLFI